MSLPCQAEKTNQAPQYDGTWRDADPTEVQTKIDTGVPHTFRFKVPKGKVRKLWVQLRLSTSVMLTSTFSPSLTQAQFPSNLLLQLSSHTCIELGTTVLIPRFSYNLFSWFQRVVIQDLVRGVVSWDAEATVGDFILLRSSGVPVYNFCVAGM